MTIETLNRSWALSSYNEGAGDQLDYYLNEKECEIGDIAYLYSHDDKELTRLKIVNIIRRSDDFEEYDALVEDEDVLIDGEINYDADTSAEFIADNDSYLVWFVYAD